MAATETWCVTHDGKSKEPLTEAQARQVVLNARIKRALYRYEKRREDGYYHCPACGAYHTTSAKPAKRSGRMVLQYV